MVGERYIAIKYPFAHGNIVTEVRIIIAAGAAWLVPVMFRIKGGNQFNVEQLIGIGRIAIVVVYILLVFI